MIDYWGSHSITKNTMASFETLKVRYSSLVGVPSLNIAFNSSVSCRINPTPLVINDIPIPNHNFKNINLKTSENILTCSLGIVRFEINVF